MDDLDLKAYETARAAAAYYQVPRGGLLILRGEDRRVFLQRQTTNDVNLLSPNRAVLTALTTPGGRILDVLYLVSADEEIWIITLPGRGENTHRYLRSRIFFMDKVSIVNASAEWILIDLIGPDAARLLASSGLADIPAPNKVVPASFGSLETYLLALEPGFAAGYRLIVPHRSAGAVAEQLDAGGAVRLNEMVFEVLRIEKGMPEADSELVEAYTPFETGLRVAVSGQKGCYTGQEVLARQVTYDKVTQSLCGLRLEDLAVSGARLWSAEGGSAGRLTSAAHSPRLGPIGLAVVKRPFNEPGTRLRIGDDGSSNSLPEGEVVLLPFPASP